MAVRWEGTHFFVSVKEVDIPKIIDLLDAIVRITSAAICGSELHTYRGRLPTKHPMTFGHENMGIIEEVGEKVTTLKKGTVCSLAPVLGKLQTLERLAKDFLENRLLTGLANMNQEHLCLMEGRLSLCVSRLQTRIFSPSHLAISASWITSFWRISGPRLGMHWNVQAGPGRYHSCFWSWCVGIPTGTVHSLHC